VQLIDLLPTLSDQLGLDLPAAAQGRTLVPLFSGSGPEAAAFAEGVKRGPEQRAVYLGAWKLIVTPSTSETGLFDLANDPLEQKNLSGRLEQERERLAEVLEKQTELNRSLSQGAPELQELTPEQIERLKSLGYVE
jgi:arylsulfatase A-like enzyme